MVIDHDDYPIQESGSIPFIHVYKGNDIINKSLLYAIMEIKMGAGDPGLGN